YADLALDAALKRSSLDPRDRALATELVYGVLRQRGRLDFALARCCRQSLARLEPDALLLLRLGTYQLLALDRVPASAAVNETVSLARRLGLERVTGFLNGVLRALSRRQEDIPWPSREKEPRTYLEHTLSLPGWLAERWLAELGDEAFPFAEALLRPAPFSLRVNTLKTNRETLLAALAEAGYSALPTVFAPEGVAVTARGQGPLPGGEEGWFQVQDEASMLIPHLVAPRPGERILDACAAPGGKTTQLAALAANRAEILALDLHSKRLRLVAEGAARLGCAGIETRSWDLIRPPNFLAPGSFDKVLVDAPCSGLGVLRRNPESRWRRTPESIIELAECQRAILDNVSPLVRPGGTLVYSLCTVTPEETEGVVAAFAAAHPEFVREDLRRELPESWRPLCDEHGALRTFPHRHGGMDAFFAVRFRRAG
ncbi:MAG TPA: 16S rRNA (cytosine(967)-C(5))-methyltransferase RsmB, partial [Desulfuromonadales bacterium]|nr:16S rRNA (cytosine(967)-C(5))-methyltransferase RsmB [Desulfuromonadales bacterium]